jgi:pSer/pThr/pTyr-binding forkhead associated (FHA) protein
MTREEMFEFLELPEDTSESEILERINDKLIYFQRLSENAPNEFLRKLHTENIKKMEALQAQVQYKEPVKKINIDSQSTNYVSANAPVTTVYGSNPGQVQYEQSNKTAVAWLVRHTENQSTKTFPLFYGKNYIGRNPHPNAATIILNEDPFVSRLHCLLEVTHLKPLQITVCDDAITNGKASKNGTYINGNEKRLLKKVTISENDTLQVGMTKFAVKLNNTNVKKIVKEVEESDYMKTVIIDIF